MGPKTKLGCNYQLNTPFSYVSNNHKHIFFVNLFFHYLIENSIKACHLPFKVRHIEVVLHMSSSSLSPLTKYVSYWNMDWLIDSLLMNRMCQMWHCITSDFELEKSSTTSTWCSLSFWSSELTWKSLASLSFHTASSVDKTTESKR